MRWLLRSAKRTTLSSIDGQYRGPVLLITPVYSGERSRPPRMISCVRSLVCVIQQGNCRGCIARSPKEREYRLRLVPGLHAETRKIDRPAVEAGRGAGLEPPRGQVELAQPRTERRGGADRRHGRGVVAQTHMNQARQERPDGQHHRAAVNRTPLPSPRRRRGRRRGPGRRRPAGTECRFGWFSSRERIACCRVSGQPGRAWRGRRALCSN